MVISPKNQAYISQQRGQPDNLTNGYGNATSGLEGTLPDTKFLRLPEALVLYSHLHPNPSTHDLEKYTGRGQVPIDIGFRRIRMKGWMISRTRTLTEAGHNRAQELIEEGMEHAAVLPIRQYHIGLMERIKLYFKEKPNEVLKIQEVLSDLSKEGYSNGGTYNALERLKKGVQTIEGGKIEGGIGEIVYNTQYEEGMEYAKLLPMKQRKLGLVQRVASYLRENSDRVLIIPEVASELSKEGYALTSAGTSLRKFKRGVYKIKGGKITGSFGKITFTPDAPEILNNIGGVYFKSCPDCYGDLAVEKNRVLES